MCTCANVQEQEVIPPQYNVYMVATSNDHVNDIAAWVQVFITKFRDANRHQYNVKYRLIHKVRYTKNFGKKKLLKIIFLGGRKQQ